MSSHHKVLAHCNEAQVSRLAQLVIQYYPANRIKILSGSPTHLAGVPDQELAADSQFNASEKRVTEVRVELDGQFGFGMIEGINSEQAVSMALVDAALRKGGPLAVQLKSEIAELAYQLELRRQELDQLAATGKIAFDSM
jgi:alpha-D-ribose 1-methylphosphonate 5-triphosphate synthase subunit PhnG